MERLPELEKPAEGGGALRGVLGAFLGALLGTAAWYGLMFLALDSWEELGKLTVLAGGLTGWLSVLGYRLFRGRRFRRFARNTVCLCCVLAQLPVLYGLLAGAVLAGLVQRGRALDPETVRLVLLSSMKELLQWKMLGVALIFALLALSFSGLSASVLLKYADPAWFSDPRRLASVNGGGALFNYLACWPVPNTGPVPNQFRVGRRLEAAGETLTFSAPLKKPVEISAGQIAGVIVGPSNGFNILYDRDNRALTKFAWSMKNADILARWLLQRKIPFFDAAGARLPDWTEQSERTPELPERFTVRESRLCLVLGGGGSFLFGTLSLGSLLLIWRKPIVGVLCLATFLALLAAFAWMLSAWHRRRLEVDGETLRYTTALGRRSEFSIRQVERVKMSAAFGGWSLLDREGRVLARLEDNMINGRLMLAYLNCYLAKKHSGLE